MDFLNDTEKQRLAQLADDKVRLKRELHDTSIERRNILMRGRQRKMRSGRHGDEA